LLFLLAAVMAIWTLPRQWAPVPLLAAACYMTLGQGLELGGLSFPVIRLVFLAGVVRVLLRQERPVGGLLAMDKWFLAWGAWAVLASAFHQNAGAVLENRMGMVFNAWSVYFLIRTFLQDDRDLYRIASVIAWILVPVALAMSYEQVARQNLFASFGGVPDEPEIRGDRIRSQGPFRHPILAGTVGAVSIPIFVGLLRESPSAARIGLVACGLIVLTSSSSGPVLTAAIGLFALWLWRWRHRTRQIRVAAALLYLLLELVMKAPAYYLLARIDIVGGSTGYHRAALIETSLRHLNEWWLAGTDYTRHWLPVGVSWSEDHVDITNHYIGQGVKGGLLQIILFVGILWHGFRYVGEGVWSSYQKDPQAAFFIWSVGSSLFAHAAACVSVAYFDQSVVFLYVTLAMCAAQKARERATLPSLTDGQVQSAEGTSGPDRSPWTAPVQGS
jgi:hypothetical protein